MSTNWKTLEEFVRAIALLRWGVACKPEHIDGVDFDGVVRVSSDEIILIEITKERNLDKVRADLNKIKPTKLRFATEGLICRGFVVLEGEPTDSMDEAGRASHITVCSAAEFGRTFFDFANYNSLRIKFPFGSAVDSKTGDNDSRKFIHVNYHETERDRCYGIEDIAKKLQNGENIVLTGDYGTGKSRCVKEVYHILKDKIRESGAFPISINLRDHWSSSSALEILAGHLGNIGAGASIDNVMRLLNSGNLVLLLDGFDEIGTQIHDTRIEDRKSIRKRAVQGVRDLIKRGKTGILITGRSHFFDSSDEMLESLGLASNHKTVCIEAPEFFSEDEGNRYLAALGVQSPIPVWLPRKPLVFQILVELDLNEVSKILSREQGQYEFWGMFIYAICLRESKGVANSIPPYTIHAILQQLAAKTRGSKYRHGRLSPSDIDSAYQAIVGSVPDQNGRQLLSRMCTLGRIEPESPDRQFLDVNVLDILRAEALVSGVAKMVEEPNEPQWKQSLGSVGIIHAAQTIRYLDLDRQCFSYLRKFGTSKNTKKLGEIVCLLNLFGNEPLDFQGLQLIGSMLPILNLSNRTMRNLTVKQSEIGIVILDGTPIKEEDGFSLIECIFTSVAGVAGKDGLPPWILNSEVLEFERISNASRIKESVLGPPQKLFLSIVHKIFFQSGGGREEASLLKGGYGQKFNPKMVESIIKILIREGLIIRRKGDDGWVYSPVRRFTDRLNKIRSELTLSEDPIWLEVNEIRQ